VVYFLVGTFLVGNGSLTLGNDIGLTGSSANCAT